MSALETLEIKTMLRQIVASLNKLEAKVVRPAAEQLCEIELKLRQARKRLLPDYLGDVAWDILLGLDQAERQQRRHFTTDVAHEANVPLTTALRYLAKMEKEGLIERIEDFDDRRRTRIVLAEKGRKLLAAVFDEALAKMEREHKSALAPLPVMIG